jgi:hypothetical protein
MKRRTLCVQPCARCTPKRNKLGGQADAVNKTRVVPVFSTVLCARLWWMGAGCVPGT